MLHHERSRLEKIALQEAAGEDLWSTNFDANLRTKITFLMQDLIKGERYYPELARQLTLRDIGLRDLAGWGQIDPVEDFFKFIEHGDEEYMPTAIEAFIIALKQRPFPVRGTTVLAESHFVKEMNDLLRKYRIRFVLADDQMTPVSSFELHQSVIEPALRLLRNSPGWEKVESAYREALDEIRDGKPDNAITDASRALEEALKVIGCDGNSLGKKIKSGIKLGLITAHDEEMLNEVEKVMHWVSADRSEKGDAHPSGEADLSDAWFHVHIVGAILVRLNEASNRK